MTNSLNTSSKTTKEVPLSKYQFKPGDRVIIIQPVKNRYEFTGTLIRVVEGGYSPRNRVDRLWKLQTSAAFNLFYENEEFESIPLQRIL